MASARVPAYFLGGGDVGAGLEATSSKGAREPTLFWEEGAALRGRESPNEAAEIGLVHLGKNLGLGVLFCNPVWSLGTSNFKDKIGGSYIQLQPLFFLPVQSFKKERETIFVHFKSFYGALSVD